MPATLNDVELLIQYGDRVQAQALLAHILKQDIRNAQAWFLLAECVTDPAQRQQCLTRCLAIDPNHTLARALLEAEPPTVSRIVEVPPPPAPPPTRPFEPRAFEAPAPQDENKPFEPQAFSLSAQVESEPFRPEPFALGDGLGEVGPEARGAVEGLPPWLRRPKA